jgi:two-component system, NarL family, sensor histidine kinase UhpB
MLKALTRNQWIAALFAILIVQLLYWAVVNPLLFVASPTPDKLTVSNVQVATLNSPGIEAMAAANFKPVELPWDDCCEPGYRGVRMQFFLPSVPEDGLGIVPTLGSDNYQMYVNGSLLFSEGSMKLPSISYHGTVRATFRILPMMLKQGRNEVAFIMVRDKGTPFFSVAAPTIGDFATIKRAYSWRQFSLNTYMAMSQAIGFAAALLALVLWLRSDRNPAIFWMAVLCLFWSLRIQHHRITLGFFHGELRIILLYVYVNLVPVALLNFANYWTGRANPWITRVSVIVFAGITAITATIIGFGLFQKVDTADRVSMAFLIMVVLSTIVLFVHHYARRVEHRHWEVATFILCATLIGHDAASNLFDLSYGDHVKRALPILLIGFLVPFFVGNVRLFRSMSEFNTLLSAQLSERTAELEVAHAHERELVREQAYGQERQRIMRDMHDGLGSQLMSMLLSARRGKLEPQRMTEGIQSVVDEMRLMIDSMDSVGESLAIALTTFHERVQSRIEAAGFTLTWTDRSGGEFPDFGPRDVLQIFRILQEAVNNALKHGASPIEVLILPYPDLAYPIRITVADHGTGMAEKRGRGRGLSNMTARAEAIGARLSLINSSGGLSVQLELPAGNAAPN